jgi:anhydro-N-acetylmuramic acid kinase
MSGTSLDGIDVAIVDIKISRSVGLKYKQVAFECVPYPGAVRRRLLQICNGVTRAAEISQMNFLLGNLYAEAIAETCRRHRLSLPSIELCGMHGQTIYHRGRGTRYLGHRIASTLQIGEAAVVAERTGLRVISNFRERDIAAGGQGAPLVPFVDYLLFRDHSIGRVALNIGGFANMTVIPAGAKPEQVIAFDTGPGNRVLDALVRRMTKGAQTCDRGGRIARAGKVRQDLLSTMLAEPYFRCVPPKSCGDEDFGKVFVGKLVRKGVPLEDLIATATELTAQSIANAIHEYGASCGEVIASGGGIHNRHIMRRLRELLPDHPVATSADYGIDPDAKEAIAFAVLAHESAHGRPCNLPSATGACRELVLGKLVLGKSRPAV